MWLSVMALFLAADPGPDSPDAVFKRMEQPILKCKTFKVDVEFGVAPGKDSISNVRLLIAQGNKMRLELDGSIKGRPGKMAIVSDGTTTRVSEDTGPGNDQETPKQLSEAALASVTRTGVFAILFIGEAVEDGKKPEPFELDKQFSVSDIKLGKKESVSGKDAQSLDYKLTTKAGKEPFAVTVWIDVKTNLPVKRAITVKEGKETFTVTESYTKAALDDKIDDREFQLPK